MNRMDAAQAEFETALRLAPQNAQTRLDLADLLATRGQAVRAEAEYRKALMQAPGAFDAHLAFARLLLRRGNAVEAKDHLQKAAASPDPALRAEAMRLLGGGR
jgi:Tfp pilus assembly protein PilF